jgi:RNA polymerase sigma-70 factor (ECF subfamily)
MDDEDVSAGSPPGSRERWAVLLPHRDRLVRLARSRVLNLADAEDVVHDALLRASDFAGLDESRVAQFLTSVVLRGCADHHRHAAIQARLLQKMNEIPIAAGADEGLYEREVARGLFAYTRTLAGREREVLLARAHGLSTMEAAQALGITLKAAESAFTRGRNRLRRTHAALIADRG